MKNIVIDGHAHACGEYLTAEKIEQKLDKAGVDMVLLTPGQWKSKTTYRLKNLAMKNPYGDVFKKQEYENSMYAFEECDSEMLFNLFDIYEKEAMRIIEKDD